MGLKPRPSEPVDLEYRPGQVAIWLDTEPCHPGGRPAYFDSDNSESSPGGETPLAEALGIISFASSLRFTSIGEAGVRALVDSPHLSKHLHLNLWGVSISPALGEAVRDRFDVVITQP